MQNNPSVEAALGVMTAHIDALNARDERAIAATLHFPHYRLSGTRLKVWENPESYFQDFRDRAGPDWKRSQFSDLSVVTCAPNKVHLDVTVLRYNGFDQEIARFRSLWVITCENAVWAAKFRSSFAQL